MKKYQKITILLATILSLVVSIVYAASDTSSEVQQEAETLTTTAVAAKVESVLSPITEDDEIKTISTFTDEKRNQSICQVTTEDYTVSLDSSSKALIGIYQKEAKYNVNTTTDKNIAENYIKSKYSAMNLPSEYDLVYLEKFDDYVWEANFQKEYNGLYNMYESVKVFFNPENDEIVALTVFDEEYTETSSTTITQENATLSATNSLDINSESIKDSELTLIKANTYFDQNNNDTSIHKAWVLTTNEEESIFVDAATGEIIGGDSLND